MGEREPATTYRKCLDSPRPRSCVRDTPHTDAGMLGFGTVSACR